MVVSRRQIIRACKSRGWMLEPTVLKAMQEYLKQQEDANPGAEIEELDDILQTIQESLEVESKKKMTMISTELWESVIETVVSKCNRDCNDDDNEDDDNGNVSEGDNDEKINMGVIIGRTSSRVKNSIGSNINAVKVVNAFETPRLVYDSLRKKFYTAEQRWSLLGSAEDKINMLGQRYQMIHQRILRHELFRPKQNYHANTISARLSQQSQLSTQSQHRQEHYALTPIETLLGKGNTDSTSFFILAVLVQIEEGSWYLEDPTGQLPVSFTDYIYNNRSTKGSIVENFFITENSILLVEATFQDGILYLQRMGLPLIEPRDTTLSLLTKQIGSRHPYYNNNYNGNSGHLQLRKNYETKRSKPNFCVVSDLHFDQPNTFTMLEALFDPYEEQAQMLLDHSNNSNSEENFPIFVFMGNFLSRASYNNGGSGSNAKSLLIQQGFDDLSSMLNVKFSTISKFATFIFIPGPNDYQLSSHSTSNIIYPQPSIMSSKKYERHYSKEHPNWHMGSNPCRIITDDNEETVIFRTDTLNYMQACQLRFEQEYNEDDELNSSGDDSDANDIQQTQTPPLHCRWIKTILDQGHLCPMPNIPIYWNYDHSLRLYPLPNNLILGGSSCNEFFEVYHDVQVIHPGSFGKNGTYATTTIKGNKDAMILDDDNYNDQSPTVEFRRVQEA